MLDWTKAPEWANYVAMDSDGEWIWYEKKPVIQDWTPWWVDTGGNGKYVKLPNWKESLQERPNN